ncbi:pilus assembly protein PilM, partial [bacterium]|nr:pilus assembly protein PilM [bacterium]
MNIGRLTAWKRRPPGRPRSDRGWSRSDRGWLAVAFSAGQCTWALARPSDHGWEVIRQGSAAAPALPAAGDSTATAPAQPEPWAANLRSELDAAHDRIVTAVAGEDVFLRVLQLPAATPAELDQMLALQIDQLSPLADEEMVYDFELLGGDDDQARVLVAIAHRNAVNQRVAVLEAAGLPPEVVDVEVLGWFRALV